MDYAREIETDHQLLLLQQRMQRGADEFGLIHFWIPVYLASRASADDNPTLQQVLASPERKG